MEPIEGFRATISRPVNVARLVDSLMAFLMGLQMELQMGC